MNEIKLSLKQARRLVLNCQLLDGKIKIPKGKEGIALIIEKLGYIQIDTIAVVERAHHHTLWTRQPNYNPIMLDALLSKERRIFEYWGHALSYLPISDYRFYLPCMQSFRDPIGKWEKDRMKKYGHLMKPALERIRKEGPLGSKDFEAPPDAKGGAWTGHPKPMKAALDLLFMVGELMVTARPNFHRIYDLTERILPRNVNTTNPNDDEVGHFFVRRALVSYGVAQEIEIVKHIKAVSKKIISQSLKNLLKNEEVIKIKIGNADGDYYAYSSVLKNLSKLKTTPKNIHILSPFDNLIIQRKRIKKLFDFDYALECYVTPAKRKHGYFVLPVLWGDTFVGRLDPKVERKKKTLIIKKLMFESGFRAYDEFLPSFASKLKEYAMFNQCGKIEIEKVSPVKIKKSLLDQLKKIDMAS